MPLAISIAIALAALASIAYPLVFLSPSRKLVPLTTASDIQRLLDSRNTLLQAVRELERDKNLGNISDQDHRIIRANYEQEAMEIYKALDARAGTIPDAIETEIARARQTLAEQSKQMEADANEMSGAHDNQQTDPPTVESPGS